MATFPTAIKSFTDRANGDTITDSFFDEPNAEITAIQTHLRSSLFSAVDSSAKPAWTSYTPTWTNGSIGDGSLTGSYLTMGAVGFISILMTAGSTTTFGGGSAWTFSLPPGWSASAGIISGIGFDGATHYQLEAYAVSSSAVGISAASGFVSSVVPFTWGNGDSFQLGGFLKL